MSEFATGLDAHMRVVHGDCDRPDPPNPPPIVGPWEPVDTPPAPPADEAIAEAMLGALVEDGRLCGPTCTQVLDERDRAREIADRLADRIAALTGVDIGEHSSMNDPWQNALNAGEPVDTPPAPLAVPASRDPMASPQGTVTDLPAPLALKAGAGSADIARPNAESEATPPAPPCAGCGIKPCEDGRCACPMPAVPVIEEKPMSTDIADVFRELRGSVDEISGSRFTWQGHEIWLHTPDQIREWLDMWELTLLALASESAEPGQKEPGPTSCYPCPSCGAVYDQNGRKDHVRYGPNGWPLCADCAAKRSARRNPRGPASGVG